MSCIYNGKGGNTLSPYIIYQNVQCSCRVSLGGCIGNVLHVMHLYSSLELIPRLSWNVNIYCLHNFNVCVLFWEQGQYKSHSHADLGMRLTSAAVFATVMKNTISSFVLNFNL